MSNNIKVAGYVKKEVYNGNIEYRNFSPDLVGLQLTSEGGTPLFTMGNFSITTNMDPKLNKVYNSAKFSDYYSLDNLTLTVEQTQALLKDNAGVILNLDKSKLKYYAMFGSLTEFVRVNLEDIITKWPASLFLSPFTTNNIGVSIVENTYTDYTYDIISDISSFKVNTNLINNKFNINYLKNGTIANTFNETNDMRNLTVNYKSYVILIDNTEYSVIGFTGSTNLTNDNIYFEVKGPVFSGQSTTINYHIKPNKINEDLFFNGLNNFESYLLNRQTFPKYRATFNSPVITDEGVILYADKDITWPVSDGYNIDFDSGEYINYATSLLNISNNSDLTNSNLMNRFLVSESISAFDTTPVNLAEEHMDTSGQKVNKTLNIYGVSFDEINTFITSISFANVVTYNKKDNMPDKFLKDLAGVLGWDLVSSVLENNLLKNYVSTPKSTYSGQEVGLTPVEADVEMWRRIILNSPWIWKSKGARKSIEFLLKFIGTPKGLIEFNEYVYLADGPINLELFQTLLELNDLDTDLNSYPIDFEGYPKFFQDNPDMYFQADGLWYKETGGSGATIDILTGNNPHIGPYDGGNRYINQLRTLIPNFSPVTITGETVVSGSTNLFINYDLGQITDYTGDTYVDVVNTDGTNLNDCVVYTAEIIKDPLPQEVLDACGCPTGLSDDALSICVKKIEKPQPKPCSTLMSKPKEDENTGYYVFEYYQYNQDGSVYTSNGQNVTRTSIFTDRECCKALNGTPVYSDIFDPITNNVESGYACCFNTKNCGCSASCNWVLNNEPVYLDNGSFLSFITLYGVGINKVTLPDESTCPAGWTTPVTNMVDPFTNEVGVGCKLTTYGLQNYQTLVTLFANRADNGDCCNFNWPTQSSPIIQYKLIDKIVVIRANTTYEFPFNLDSPETVKCKTLNPTSGFDNLPVSLGTVTPSPWSFTPISIGTQLYTSNVLGAAPYNSLNGNFSIDVNIVNNTTNTGLQINQKYVIQITNGVVTNIINFNALSSC
jgi:hypothetical protein